MRRCGHTATSGHDLEMFEFEVTPGAGPDVGEGAMRAFESLAKKLRMQLRKTGPFVAVSTGQAAVIRRALHRGAATSAGARARRVGAAAAGPKSFNRRLVDLEMGKYNRIS